ncbi:MAG: GTPase Era [Nitrospina sp.]|jgi:GTPase|nr:GTPase Era [Nitrospina sp.]MBT3509770.1 GTPase Era [Nitrospina sp.]MBT3874869.1 GTPase Era [Nitrospina sp.]MBT4049768.1 GTPase Era [Nitrospina sp.]MBT4558750.1 GTPase Era [Nitrospina sp.]
MTDTFKSGYASIVGRPNVGKSTLLNRLLMQKVAVTSRRPQTTRNKITGVLHLPNAQIILVDTPGIHQSERTLNEMMVRASVSTFSDVDLILVMLSADAGFCDDDEFVLNSMKQVKTKKVLVINKIDLVEKPILLSLMNEMNQKSLFEEIIPISALKEDGLDQLKSLILSYLPEGPEYFPKDMVTDCPETFLFGEIIREKILNLTRFEVPHSVAVVVEDMHEQENGVVQIDATIFAEKDSQKKILIGEGGNMLKNIGRQARQELEKRLGAKIFLKLFVKVKANWRDQSRAIKEFGYTHDSF